MHLILLVFLFLIQACGEKGTFVNNGDQCDGYGNPTTSNYILPYQSGEAYEVTQGNCGQVTHRAQVRFAYDFDMPDNATIIAVRAGVVHEVEVSNSDSGGSGWNETNYIYIVHNDGTMAAYVHLLQNGALVSVGETVAQGQPIALSGNSGTQVPHLHFQVYSNQDSFRTIPVNFRNQGVNTLTLKEGNVYTAAPFTPNNN